MCIAQKLWMANMWFQVQRETIPASCVYQGPIQAELVQTVCTSYGRLQDESLNMLRVLKAIDLKKRCAMWTLISYTNLLLLICWKPCSEPWLNNLMYNEKEMEVFGRVCYFVDGWIVKEWWQDFSFRHRIFRLQLLFKRDLQKCYRKSTWTRIISKTRFML